MWSGLSLGVTPAMTALLAPFWGRLADRFGRKIMVERSLASFVLVMVSMAFVTKAWHVFALRAIQGLFAGYGALTLTMAADSAPRDRMAQAIGQVQTAQRLGPALGPHHRRYGARRSSGSGTRSSSPRPSMSSRSSSSSSCITSRSRTDARLPRAAPDARPGELPHRAGVRELRPADGGGVFGLQFVDRSFGPILPLYLGELGTPLARMPLVAGVLFSIAAGAGALGNYVCSRLLASHRAAAVIAGSAAAGRSARCLYAVAGPIPRWVFAVTPLFGAAMGIATTGGLHRRGRGHSRRPRAARASGC